MLETNSPVHKLTHLATKRKNYQNEPENYQNELQPLLSVAFTLICICSWYPYTYM